MAKKRTEKLGDTVGTLRPYVERALTDEEFRQDLRDAVKTARQLYGDLGKGNGGVKSAKKLATDKRAQEQLRKALDDLGKAGGRIKGGKKKRKARKALLATGVIVGALYNPWTGPQTRKWLLDKIAGEDDLQPLESFESAASSAADEAAEIAAEEASKN